MKIEYIHNVGTLADISEKKIAEIAVSLGAELRAELSPGGRFVKTENPSTTTPINLSEYRIANWAPSAAHKLAMEKFAESTGGVVVEGASTYHAAKKTFAVSLEIRWDQMSLFASATEAELTASLEAAERDGGCGAITVDGVTCYVEGGAA